MEFLRTGIAAGGVGARRKACCRRQWSGSGTPEVPHKRPAGVAGQADAKKSVRRQKNKRFTLVFF